MNYTVIPLTEQYLDQMMVIERASFSQPWTRESYRHDLNENVLSHYLGLLAEDQLIGYVGLWLIVDEGHIGNIAVAPAWRQQGVGETLLRALIAHCRGFGCVGITLEVRESNRPAIGLYEKLGFVPEGRRPHYYTDGDETALIYWLHLEEQA